MSECILLDIAYVSEMLENVTNLDLSLHGDAEEHDEVHHKDRPEHWYVKGFKECANHSNDDAFCRRMPESVNKTTMSGFSTD